MIYVSMIAFRKYIYAAFLLLLWADLIAFFFRFIRVFQSFSLRLLLRCQPLKEADSEGRFGISRFLAFEMQLRGDIFRCFHMFLSMISKSFSSKRCFSTLMPPQRFLWVHWDYLIVFLFFRVSESHVSLLPLVFTFSHLCRYALMLVIWCFYIVCFLGQPAIWYFFALSVSRHLFSLLSLSWFSAIFFRLFLHE